jgi:hypothetical protein
MFAGRDLCHVDRTHQRILAGERQPRQCSAAVSVAGPLGNAHPLMPRWERQAVEINRANLCG